jgi:hypothetical protein
MTEKRKKMDDDNKKLLRKIERLSPLTSIIHKHYSKKIHSQSEEEQIHAYLAASTNGFLDGLYLYMGVLSLAAFSYALFLAMAVFSAIYVVACIITRIYEEYEFQVKHEIIQTKCKLGLRAKELEIVYNRLILLKGNDTPNLSEINNLKQEFCTLLPRLEKQRLVLNKQTTQSYWTMGLLGMKYGLYGYGAVTSILFTSSSLFFLSSMVIPPALLAVFIVSGIVLMLGFTAYNLREQHLNVQKKKQEEDSEAVRSYAKLNEMKSCLELGNDAGILPIEVFNKSLQDSIPAESSPKSSFLAWFEALRSSASGLAKGSNLATAVTMQQDASVTNALATILALLFLVIMFLRALARGFGRQTQSTPEQNPPPEPEHNQPMATPKPKPSKPSKPLHESAPSSSKKSSKSSNSLFLGSSFKLPKRLYFFSHLRQKSISHETLDPIIEKEKLIRNDKVGGLN